jgi:predicted transglutaminase-like cysteine proteinase
LMTMDTDSLNSWANRHSSRLAPNGHDDWAQRSGSACARRRRKTQRSAIFS